MTLLLLLHSHSPVHRSYLEYAQRLHDQGEHVAAVVFSQTACELLSEIAISSLFAQRNCKDLEEVVTDLFPSYGLTNDRVRNIYNALSGERIQEQSFWSEFVDAARRRHGAVHKGRGASQEDAVKSLAVARKFIDHLEEVLKHAKPSS